MKKIFLAALLAAIMPNIALATQPETANSTYLQQSANANKELRTALYGEWNVTQLRGKSYITGSRAFINLDFDNLKLYGYTGSHVINGDFKAKDKSISFAHIINDDNRRMESHEKNLVKALTEVSSYDISQSNGIDILTLLNSRGHKVMQLKRQNLDFLNGIWIVREIDGTDVSGDKVKVAIDVASMRLHGYSGCNIINGIITIDPNTDWAIQFDNINSKANNLNCPTLSTETNLLVALEKAVTVYKESNKSIEFIDIDDNIVLVLDKVNEFKR